MSEILHFEEVWLRFAGWWTLSRQEHIFRWFSFRWKFHWFNFSCIHVLFCSVLAFSRRRLMRRLLVHTVVNSEKGFQRFFINLSVVNFHYTEIVSPCASSWEDSIQFWPGPKSMYYLRYVQPIWWQEAENGTLGQIVIKRWTSSEKYWRLMTRNRVQTELDRAINRWYNVPSLEWDGR